MDGRANTQEIKNACLALNTAEYCLTTSSQVGLRSPISSSVTSSYEKTPYSLKRN